MRIDSYSQVAQLYKVQKSVGSSNIQKNAAVGSDQLSISQAGRDYQVAKAAVQEASGVREEKVAKLKSMIQAGTYSVDANDFATKLLDNYKSITV